ncbi:hypothetical protein [Kitasatospora sp. NPDC002040]|uniref:hypothetical protein n=1 Tax=Kitasatospora sp. NPDC002040 TaxID=3154661 RepID=UPI0033256985
MTVIPPPAGRWPGPLVAAACAGAVLGAGATPSRPGAPDWLWCAAALLGLVLALGLLLVGVVGRTDPRVGTAGLLLLGGAVPAATTLDSPLLAGAATTLAVLSGAAAGARPARWAVLGGAVVGAVAGAAAPAVATAAAGTVASTYGLLLLAAAACATDLTDARP